MPGGALALAGEDASARLGYIQRRLRRGAARSRAWAISWGSIYATTAAVQLVRIPLSESPTTQIESGIAAGSAALGVGFVIILPPAILADQARLDRQIAGIPRGGDVCPVLADAERYLVRDAANQAFGVGWLMQSVTVAYNIGLGLVFGLALHDWTVGAITTLSGIAVSELMTLTQPTDAIDALRRYRAGDLRPTTATSTSYWIAAPDVAPGRVGMRVGAAF